MLQICCLIFCVSFFILGLVAYPYLEDGSSVISFDPMDYNSYNKYIENMEFHMNGN